MDEERASSPDLAEQGQAEKEAAETASAGIQIFASDYSKNQKTVYESGKLCSKLRYETNIPNAPSLFVLYPDGSGMRLLRDADVYPYLKSAMSNSNSEIIEESVEQGIRVSVLENSTFRQVNSPSFSNYQARPIQYDEF